MPAFSLARRLSIWRPAAAASTTIVWPCSAVTVIAVAVSAVMRKRPRLPALVKPELTTMSFTAKPSVMKEPAARLKLPTAALRLCEPVVVLATQVPSSVASSRSSKLAKLSSMFMSPPTW